MFLIFSEFYGESTKQERKEKLFWVLNFATCYILLFHLFNDVNVGIVLCGIPLQDIIDV